MSKTGSTEALKQEKEGCRYLEDLKIKAGMSPGLDTKNQNKKLRLSIFCAFFILNSMHNISLYFTFFSITTDMGAKSTSTKFQFNTILL